MLEWLQQLFAVICGQNPAHTWAPGGLPLPCCQRCTGLYVGAAVAVCLHGWLRPRLTGRFLGVHGLFLLLMVPFGYHWLPQTASVRAGTGVLFGFGVVTYLWLIPARRWLAEKRPRPQVGMIYGGAIVLVLLLLPLAAARGGQVWTGILSGLAFGGVGALLVLASLNLGLGAWSLIRLRPRRRAS